MKANQKAKGTNDMAASDTAAIKTIGVGFILITIALLIALTILPTLTSQVETAASDGNLSAAAAAILRLVPTVLVVGLLGGGVAFLVRGFKSMT